MRSGNNCWRVETTTSTYYSEPDIVEYCVCHYKQDFHGEWVLEYSSPPANRPDQLTGNEIDDYLTIMWMGMALQLSEHFINEMEMNLPASLNG